MKPGSAIQIKSLTPKNERKKGLPFVQLMKEVEKVAKEPRKPKSEEPIIVQNKAQDFTKNDFTNDQFGELLNLVKPKPNPKTKPQNDKTTKPKRVPQSAKLPPKTQPEKSQPKKQEKLKKEVVVEPRTIDELIRNPHMSSDDENYWGDALDNYPTVKNPFREEQEPGSEKTTPKADFAAFDTRTKDYLDKKQKRLEKLKQDSAPTFKPTINKKSEILDKKRNRLDEKTTRFDNLYDVEYINKQQEKNLKRDNASGPYDLKEDDIENCTFRPQINKYERSPYDDKVDISERQKVWAQNKQEKIRELQEFKQIKEVTECTFKPDVNKSDLPVMSRLYYK